MNTHAASRELVKLIEIMTALRSPGGCPWDRQQTADSLKPYLLEETYELLDAIDKNELNDICDEMGDLLLQIVFLAQIYSEKDAFDLSDVAKSINSKMIRRHPHVFADADKEDHARRWEEIKKQEREERGVAEKLADQIPKQLPALKTAMKVAKKMPATSPQKQLIDIQKRYTDLALSISEQGDDTARLQNLLGEILFSTAKLSATLQQDAEDLLRQKTMHVIAELDREKSYGSGHHLQSS